MTSGDFWQFSRTSQHGFGGCQSSCPLPPCKTSPIKSSNLPLIYLPHLHHGVRAVWNFVLFGRLVRPRKCLICDFCSSDREFALGLLQIPPHGGHPCPQLTLPNAKRVADFHRLVTAHFCQTNKEQQTFLSAVLRVIVLLFHQSDMESHTLQGTSVKSSHRKYLKRRLYLRQPHKDIFLLSILIPLNDVEYV